MSEESDISENLAEDDPWAAALEEQAEAEAQQAEAMEQSTSTAPLETLSDSSISNGNSDVNLDMILDVPVTISMEIGRTKINVRNLLQLTQGSVIELDRFAGEAMDVLINNTLIAHGEVVVVNDKFGIRMTDIISAEERVKKLR